MGIPVSDHYRAELKGWLGASRDARPIEPIKIAFVAILSHLGLIIGPTLIIGLCCILIPSSVRGLHHVLSSHIDLLGLHRSSNSLSLFLPVLLMLPFSLVSSLMIRKTIYCTISTFIFISKILGKVVNYLPIITAVT